MVKIIEARLPLAWLIGTASVIIFSLGGLYVKIDSLARAIENQETRAELQQNQINNTIIETKRNEYSITFAMANIAEVKTSFAELKSDFKLAVYRFETQGQK